MMSSMCSMPTESRTISGVTPTRRPEGSRPSFDSLRADAPGYNPSRAFFMPSPRFIQAARTIIRSQPIQKSRTPRSI